MPREGGGERTLLDQEEKEATAWIDTAPTETTSSPMVLIQWKVGSRDLPLARNPFVWKRQGTAQDWQPM